MLDKTWPWFLLMIGIVFLMALVAVLYEKSKTNDHTLLLKPKEILWNIVLIQLTFYLLYFITISTVNVLYQQRFWASQMFGFTECSFFGTRGLIAFLSLAIAVVLCFLPITFFVQRHQEIVDYLLTLVIIHFVVVSIYENDFPANGSWWVSLGVGFILSALLTDQVCYRLYKLDLRTLVSTNAAGPRRPRHRQTNALQNLAGDLMRNNEEDNGIGLSTATRAAATRARRTEASSESSSGRFGGEIRRGSVVTAAAPVTVPATRPPPVAVTGAVRAHVSDGDSGFATESGTEKERVGLFNAERRNSRPSVPRLNLAPETPNRASAKPANIPSPLSSPLSSVEDRAGGVSQINSPTAYDGRADELDLLSGNAPRSGEQDSGKTAKLS